MLFILLTKEQYAQINVGEFWFQNDYSEASVRSFLVDKLATLCLRLAGPSQLSNRTKKILGKFVGRHCVHVYTVIKKKIIVSICIVFEDPSPNFNFTQSIRFFCGIQISITITFSF